MNKEQQELLYEAYNNYGKKMVDIINVLISAEFKDKGWVKLNNQGKYDVLSQEDFINKCKTDQVFSEKWGLKIEEREKLDIGYNVVNKQTLYSEIETLIIKWNIDGTKTAGSLTRDIMKLIENELNPNIKL